MAAQTVQSNLIAELGALGKRISVVHEKNKAAPAESRGLDLPAGIKGGVGTVVLAKLDKYKPGKKNEGKLYAIFQCQARRPLTHNGERVKGRRFNKMVDLFDDPSKKIPGTEETQTIESRWVELLDLIKNFGFPVTIRWDQLEGLLAEITKRKPNFTYQTRGYTLPANPPNFPNAREGVNTDITGPFEGVISEDAAGAGVVDNTVASAAPAAATAVPSKNGTAKKAAAAATPTPTPEPEPEPEDDAALSILELGEAADGGDEAACKTLKMEAIALGYTDEDVEKFETWTILAQTIDAGEGPASDDSGGNESDDNMPVIGSQWNYQIKTGGKMYECEVTKVIDKDKTVDIKLTDGSKKTYKGVPWAKLKSLDNGECPF